MTEAKLREPLPDLSGRRVLIVDDSEDTLFLLNVYLNLAGAETELASDGWQGVQRAICGHFDLILMDLEMPGWDGCRATRWLRDHGYRGPIVALSAHAGASQRLRASHSGFNDYAVKPLGRRFLVEWLDQCLANPV